MTETHRRMNRSLRTATTTIDYFRLRVGDVLAPPIPMPVAQLADQRAQRRSLRLDSRPRSLVTQPMGEAEVQKLVSWWRIPRQVST
jgi:hypothetical protein